MLKQRIVTGIGLSLLVGSAILYLPAYIFNMVALLVVTLAVWEYSSFFCQENKQQRVEFLVLFFLAFIGARFVPVWVSLLIGGIWWLGAPYILWHYTVTARPVFTKRWQQWILGVVIFVPCLIGLLAIRETLGPEFLLYVLAIICATDIGGYFSGVLWGKHLLAPQLSPKKTKEGVLGGLLLAVLVTIIGAWWLKFGGITGRGVMLYFTGIQGISLLILVVVVGLWSVIGDLVESMLKRQAGVKDSGRILPGHGGIYDRLDSLTAALPLFGLGLLLI